ncbi:hypothetical protein DQ04_05201000 [Trypanosoma grayi]|uniref:hypothetical protein n=1 Tax=Trypanosoma grayi TaxID=71804 RepID=UPI0004F49D29|nr:hypothetical protein DQ04_05201000 [Trypanosoma grayi]KEG09448.1 hypothetical protein DQ04_05201000 [Trypanosoma grayi]
MTAVPNEAGLNNSWRRAASGSAFPPALPPRPPAAAGADGHSVSPLISEGAEELAVQYPLITAADYSDRKRLLSHITFLSGQLQRAELLLRKTPHAMVSDAELARFDPAVAQAHIERLDSALAQVGLLREVETAHSRTMDEELRGLREERNRLVERVDELQSRATSLEAENTHLHSALSSSQLEVERLRLEEAKMSHRLQLIDQLQEDGGRYHGVSVVVAPPRQETAPQEGCDQALKELQIEETVQRLNLLLAMLMQPMCIAFDAGVVWITETQLHRASVEINNVVVPDVLIDSTDLPAIVEGNSPVGQPGDDTMPPATVTAEDAGGGAWRVQQQQMCCALEAMKERCRITEQERARLMHLLHEEQRRTEAMAKDHYEQLEQVHKQVVHERRQIMESLVTEVEEKMRNAFRDGRLYEKRLMDEKKHKRKHPSGHTSTATTRQRGAGSFRAASATSEDRQITSNSKRGRGRSTGGSSSSSISSGSGGVPRGKGERQTGAPGRNGKGGVVP